MKVAFKLISLTLIQFKLFVEAKREDVDKNSRFIQISGHTLK